MEKLDRGLLEETINIAMRMLDNVVDLNFYPTIEAKNSNMKHRPIGLGIMGLQDALFKLIFHLIHNSGFKFSDQVMEQISYHAISASSDLAKERGSYSSPLKVQSGIGVSSQLILLAC